jgi:uncharacterized protein (TIGR02569 family)
MGHPDQADERTRRLATSRRNVLGRMYSPSVNRPVPAKVLRAFGVDSPLPLSGGQGTSWRAGGLVLKPEGGPAYEWLAHELSNLQPDGVRISAPVRTVDGEWVCDGWSAKQWVEGSHPDFRQPSTWSDIIQAGRAFHRMVRHLPRPDSLTARTGPWATADRVAWGDQPSHLRQEFAEVARLLQHASRPLGPSQIVHGDLTGNVLFAPGAPPAVIDISPYWRPPEYAEGVVIADALCWHGASASVLQEVGVSVTAVARALLFRLVTTNELLLAGLATVDPDAEAERYRRAASLIGL